MEKHQKVSIVIPVYNERKTISDVLARVLNAYTLGLRKEVIVVDDHSTDGTTDILKQNSDPNIRVIFSEKNQGKGAALKIGFGAASGDIILIQDADLEYDPAEIHLLLRPFLEQGAQAVYGSRYLNPSPDLNFWHSFFNKFFSNLGNLLIGSRVTDIMTCYKAFSREALQSFLDKLESHRFGFEPEVTARLARAGFQIIEIPISYHPRSQSEGKHMNLAGQLESLWGLIKYSLLKK